METLRGKTGRDFFSGDKYMNNYKQIRQAANLSLSEIALFLGVGSRMVRYYEDGQRIPSASVERLYNAVKGNSPDFKAWLKEKVGKNV